MAQLFGYSLDRKKKGSLQKGPSFVRKDSEDAAEPIVAGGYFGQYVDFGDKESSKGTAVSYTHLTLPTRTVV